MSPRGGLMLGVNRSVSARGNASFEFLRIAAVDGAVDYHASVGGRPAVAFRLTEHRDRRVVFSNPDHDFPQRILYWIDADGALHARIEGVQAGEERAMEWIWERRDWSAEPAAGHP